MQRYDAASVPDVKNTYIKILIGVLTKEYMGVNP
ncbi:UNVERIFIED_ORG: hypothetical protein DFS12_103265 [Chitinophaga ginsengisegetis]|nr:hypothetical protein [Chitinophaga ginsengisegetis]MDR6647677.1 hypothetical protein [Chitinophaga ginsengisegetis]MDR6654027.1 hypothetical protein [Chitinophaga ginsengisegetis]